MAVNSWFRMYNEVVDDPKVQRLPPVLFRAWVNLLCLASRNGGDLPPLDDIAYGLRITKVRAESFVETLIKDGLFDRDGDGVKPHNWVGRQFKSDGSRERTAKWRSKRHGDGDGDVTVTADVTNTRQTEQNRQTDPPIVPQKTNGKPEAVYSVEFEQFWAAFPKRVGKGEAHRLWKKLKPSQTLLEIILASVERQKRSYQWVRDEGRYIPNPATWLNQSRWDDDSEVQRQAIDRERLKPKGVNL